MPEYTAAPLIHLDAWDLALAAALVLVAGAISVGLRLGMGRRLALASVRTVAQLLVVGYVLKFVFALNSGPLIMLVVVVMTAMAGRTAVARAARTFRGVTWRAIAALFTSGLLTTVVVTGVIVGATPWYTPQYLIPLLGMVLGNALTGISLCLDYLLDTLATRSAEVDMELSLGASRWEAARGPVSDAVRRGMIPIINTMMVVGIVSLPGMMTGQILAGADPLEAVKYQIVVMFMVAAGTSLGCITIALAAYARLFNARHQLRTERITVRT